MSGNPYRPERLVNTRRDGKVTGRLGLQFTLYSVFELKRPWNAGHLAIAQKAVFKLRVCNGRCALYGFPHGFGACAGRGFVVDWHGDAVCYPL